VAAAAAPALKTVHYRRYALRVPASWPVFKLASDPSACVRFDRHAVYLGRPSTEQRCPAHAVGRTEAILVQPLAALAARSGAASMLPAARTAKVQEDIGELVAPARAVVVTATWANHPATIERALGLRSIPAAPVRAAAAVPGAGAARSGSVAARARQASAPAAGRGASSRFDAVNVGGLGFDTCSAPSTTAMSAWLESSPFRAAAIYIGGANSACTQPNLSASWVSAESAAGWQFIPVYVGLQAPSSSCGCAEIQPAQATAEGIAAATDAATQAAALGIGQGNPIYFDMEAYTQKASTTSAALAFLSAWTSQLDAYGYTSGVYGSASSGITDLVDALGTTFVEPDDIWIADWNGNATASDPYVPAGDWFGNQRLHQYRGGHVDDYGGVKIDIDTDYLDGATATAGTGVGPVTAAALPDGTFVSYGGNDYRIAGGAPLYVHDWSVYGGPQPTVALVAAQWKALNPLPANGTFITATGTGKVYRIAGGAPVYVDSWSPFGGPQPTVVIDRWDIQNISNSITHLRAQPETGTIVEGLPSGRYWQFSAGMRTAAAPSYTAVSVEDVGLTSFLESPTASRVTLWGIARRKPKLRVTVTAGANAPSLHAFYIKLPHGLAFTRSGTQLIEGLGVWNAHDRALESTFRLSHGVLRIKLRSPAREVRIAAAIPSVSSTRALAAELRTRAVRSLEVVLQVFDAKHHEAVLTLDPGAS